MALIPLKQTITVYPAGNGDDPWNAAPPDPYTLKCRIQEGTKLTRRATSSGGVSTLDSGEVVSTAQIYLDKLANIGETDEIEYEDENGLVRRYYPLSVEVKRNLAGKPILTVVNV